MAKQPLTEKQMAEAEQSVKAFLDSCEKVPLEIPEDPNNPDDVVPIGFNGVIYAVPRDREFMVPKPIYEIWKYSHTETQKVQRRIRESVTKEIQIIG